jgi:hypothetical protein
MKRASERSKTTQPRAVRVKPATYQPTWKELEEEFDMPGWSLEELREKVLGPVKLVDDEGVPA